MLDVNHFAFRAPQQHTFTVMNNATEADRPLSIASYKAGILRTNWLAHIAKGQEIQTVLQAASVHKALVD